jgi:hypothetical protein
MTDARIDHLARLLSGTHPRRGHLQRLVAAGLLMASGALPSAHAKKRRKQNRRGKPNAFGCLDVGQRCGGQSAACCSGVCQGKKAKKGRRDRSKCVAHNTGGCVATEQSCGADNADVPCGVGGFCLLTTGNAAFCGDVTTGVCAACRRDDDCAFGFGAGAACILCDNDFCEATGSRACVPAAA